MSDDLTERDAVVGRALRLVHDDPYLVVAAPDLLAALEMITNITPSIEDNEHRCVATDAIFQAFAIAHAAIAAATGAEVGT